MHAPPFTTVPAYDALAIVDALYRFAAGQDLRNRALFDSALGNDAVVDFTGPAQRLGVTIPEFRAPGRHH